MMNKALFGLAVLVFSLLTFQTATRFTFRTGVATDTLESRTASLHPVVNDSLDIVGRITKYNNVLTQGYGVPAIVGWVNTQTAGTAIGETNLNASTAGFYRVNVYLECDGYDVGGDSVYAKIGWNTAGGMKYDSTSKLLLTALGVKTHKVFVFYHTTGDTLTYQTLGGFGLDDTYQIAIMTERLN